MSDDDGAAIDPRYDPAFQRGFSGEVATGPRGQSTLRRTAAVNPAPSRAPQRVEDPPAAVSAATTEAGFTPTTASATSPSSPRSASDAATPAATGSLPAVATGAVGAVGPRELARNPFVVALAVLGAVLLIAGVVWAYEGFAMIIKNGGTRNEVEFWSAQTMSFGAPLTVVLGLAVAAVLLVLFARAWQRGRS